MLLSQFTIPANDIENLRYWYMRYFAMSSSALHTDEEEHTRSYMLSCRNDSCSLLIADASADYAAGHARLAVSVASREGVDFLTELLRTDNYVVVVEPSRNVYGVYRSVVLDPEGNRVSVVE